MTIKYVASDGKEFLDKKECIEYERTISRVSDLIPELVLDTKLPPISVYLNGYINDAGYLIDLKNIGVENYLLKNSEDKNKVIKALKDLGYDNLAQAIVKESIKIYPEVISLITTTDYDLPRAYRKFACMRKQYAIVDEHRESIIKAISEAGFENLASSFMPATNSDNDNNCDDDWED